MKSINIEHHTDRGIGKKYSRLYSFMMGVLISSTNITRLNVFINILLHV